MRWDSDLATVVLGLNDNVPNELGFKNFWLVKNQTGSTITKGSLVYANGTVGASGRITVAKFIANGTIDAKYLLGITAHDLSNGEDGYVISFGKIRKVNTDTFATGAILYPSPTTAGVWTDVEPVAPNINMPIGFCINSHVNNGTIAIRVASGYSLNELHNVAISSPVEKSSLYYSGGLWRDTTAALLVSDTSSMLTNYLRTGVAATTYLPLTGGTLTGALNGTSATLTGNISNPKIVINSTAFSSYTTDGLFGATATPATYTPLANSTSGKLLFGYKDAEGGQYVPRIGFTSNSPNTVTKSSIGLEPISGDFTINGGSSNSENLRILASNGNASFKQRLTVGASTNYDALNVHHTSEEGFRMSYQSEPTNYFFQIRPNVTSSNVRYVLSQFNAGNFYDSVIVMNQGNVAINKLNPAYKLDVNGTLGVTGASTLTGALTVNNATVLNEGSGDFDTRIESDGNANMVFVDASTDRVGIGTASPSKTLDVNGEVRIATVTATPTALLGKDGSNVVGEVALGTGMSVSGGILSVQAAGASATGLVTSFGSQIFGGNKTFNGTVTFENNAFFKKNIELPIVKINNTDYTATTSNHTIIYTILTADKTLTIPNAADAVGMKYIISIFDIPEGNEALTLVTPSSNLFVRTDGESSNVDIVGGYCTTIQSDGTKWYILSYAPMY
jgi:hypothetical protein